MKNIARLLIVTATSVIVLAGCMPEHKMDQQMQATQQHAQNVNKQAMNSSQAPMSMADSEITANVKARLMSDKVFGMNGENMPIHIKTTNGVVYLSGRATREQAHNAVVAAESTQGVKQVVSKVMIKNS